MQLLSEELHGPGSRFENIAPGDKGANKKMETNFKSFAKSEVKKGSILWYHVDVSYRSGSDSDFPKEVAISLGRWTPDPDAPEDPSKGKPGPALNSQPPVPVDPPGKAGDPRIPIIN